MRILLVISLTVLPACATLTSIFGDDALNYADKMVKEICKLEEPDRLPIRQMLMERYGVDTSGVCQKVRPVPATS